ncbi:MAG: hypothetical protein AB8B36_11220, partial [Prochlorococcus sp.]
MKKRHLRTGPWSGKAAIKTPLIAIALCLPLRGSVRLQLLLPLVALRLLRSAVASADVAKPQRLFV